MPEMMDKGFTVYGLYKGDNILINIPAWFRKETKKNYSQDYVRPQKSSPSTAIFKTHLIILPSLESRSPSQSHSMLPSVPSPPTLKICWRSLSSTASSCYPNGSCHFSLQAPSKTPFLNTVLSHNQTPCSLWGPTLYQLAHNPLLSTLSLDTTPFLAAQSILLPQRSRQQVVTLQKTASWSLLCEPCSVAGIFTIKLWKQQKCKPWCL